MPRPSYEEHRARKRRGSFIESETDAESLASFTTHQSTASYQPYAYASSSRLTVPRPRTLSSTSFSSTPSPHLATRSTSPAHTARLGVDDATATKARREARRKRREERERKSTLLGERYDSPLRRVVRWCAKNEWKGRYMVVSLILSLVVRTALAVVRTRHDVARTRQMLLWLAGKTTRLRSLAGWSDQAVYRLDLAGQVLADTFLWYHAVESWTKKESESAGRSWRTQAIAFSTLMFAPAFLLPMGDLWASQWTLASAVSFVRSLDQHRLEPLVTIWIYALLLVNLSLAPLLPAIAVHATTRHLAQARAHLAEWDSTSLATHLRSALRVFMGLTYTLDPWLAPMNLAFSLRRFADVLVSFDFLSPDFDLEKLDCPAGGPNVWCASDVMIHWTRWVPPRIFTVVAALLAAFTLLPSLAILCYATFSSGPGTHRSPPASVRLLPTALFTSSLGIVLFTPSSQPAHLVTALLPLSLMTCLRGGKDEVEDDEGWEYGVLVHNVGSFALLPTWSRQGLAVPAMGLTVLWNWLIGYNPLKAPNASVRNNTLTVYAGIVAVCALERVYPLPARFPGIWDVLRCLITFAVLETAWIWGLTRLYLQAWGLVGLGSGKED